MEKEVIEALETAFTDEKIKDLRIRRVNNLLVVEITGDALPVSGSAAATLPKENILLLTLAVAMNQFKIHTSAVEEAEGKVLPFYANFPL